MLIGVPLVCLWLHVFRESRDVLENALEVYLNEPVLDWVSGVIDKGMLDEQVMQDDAFFACGSDAGN